MFLHIFFCLFVPSYVGYVTQRILFRREKPLLLMLSLAYGLGLGILTQWMLLIGILGISFSVRTIGWPLLITAGILHGWHYVHHRAPGQKKTPGTLVTKLKSSVMSISRGKRKIIFAMDPLSSLFLLYILWATFFIGWQTLFFPLNVWDELSFIAFNGKVFFYEKNLFPLQYLPHPSFPLFMPFSFCWTALNLGTWDEQWVKVFIFPLMLSFLALCYVFLRHHTNQRWSLLGLVLLLSSAFFCFHASLGYRDAPLAYYNVTTLILLLFWYSREDDAYLILASLSAGFMTFTKLVGGLYFFIHLLLFYWLIRKKGIPFRRQIIPCLKFFAPGTAIFLFFILYKLSSGIPMNLTEGRLSFSSLNTTHLQNVLLYLGPFVKSVFFSSNWNILWAILIVSFVGKKLNRQSQETKFLLLALLLFLGSQQLYWLGLTLMGYAVFLATDFNRGILHFFPLVPLLIVLLNSHYSR